MNNMRIVEIPASMRENSGRKSAVRKLRVAAYCRVSTEEFPALPATRWIVSNTSEC